MHNSCIQKRIRNKKILQNFFHFFLPGKRLMKLLKLVLISVKSRFFCLNDQISNNECYSVALFWILWTKLHFEILAFEPNFEKLNII